MEWFPNEPILDAAAIIVLVAFPVFVALAAIILKARPHDPIARRLAVFLLFHTIYQITWVNELIAVSPRVDFALSQVNRAATAMDASVYLAFVAVALGWKIYQKSWFLPALILIPIPFVASVVLVSGDWWASPWGTTVQILASATWTFGFLYSTVRWVRTHGAKRRQYGLYALALGSKEIPFLLQTIARLIFDATGFEPVAYVQLFLAAIVGHLGLLVMALVLAYAILRHHLFDMNLRLRWTISRATIITIFVAVASTVQLAASEFLVDRLGYVAGAATIGLMIPFIGPLRRWSDRLASKAIPDARRVDELDDAGRLSFYQEQLEIAFNDGALTPKELAMLDRFRERLGLSNQDVARVHRKLLV